MFCDKYLCASGGCVAVDNRRIKRLTLKIAPTSLGAILFIFCNTTFIWLVIPLVIIWCRLVVPDFEM